MMTYGRSRERSYSEPKHYEAVAHQIQIASESLAKTLYDSPMPAESVQFSVNNVKYKLTLEQVHEPEPTETPASNCWEFLVY